MNDKERLAAIERHIGKPYDWAHFTSFDNVHDWDDNLSYDDVVWMIDRLKAGFALIDSWNDAARKGMMLAMPESEPGRTIKDDYREALHAGLFYDVAPLPPLPPEYIEDPY